MSACKKIAVFTLMTAFLPALAQAEPNTASQLPHPFDMPVLRQIVDIAQANDATAPKGAVAGDIESAFQNLQSDPDPDELVRNSHYWVSNENAHYVWYPHVRDMAGGLAGVGTDQLYLIAGWMNASIMIPMDFDRKITGLHFAYGAAFLEADDIAAFLNFWNPNSDAQMRAALEKHFPDKADAVMQIWKTAQPTVRARFGKIARRYAGKHADDKTANIPTFVSDETQYARVRDLWRNHRVYPVCGDLTGSIGMRSIAEALQKTGMKLGAFYTSNAGQYFSYSQNFVQNFTNMPFAENGLILRTRQLSSLGVAEPEDYHYNIQNAGNFKQWLESGKVSDMPAMLRMRCRTATMGLSMIQELPLEISSRERRKVPQCQ